MRTPEFIPVDFIRLLLLLLFLEFSHDAKYHRSLHFMPRLNSKFWCSFFCSQDVHAINSTQRMSIIHIDFLLPYHANEYLTRLYVLILVLALHISHGHFRCEKQCAGIRVYPKGTWFKELKKVSDSYSSSARFRKFNTLAEAEGWLR